MRQQRRILGPLVFTLACIGGCAGEEEEHGEEEHDHEHETEIISTVELSFTPDDGGAPVVAAFTDPDGDGGVSGMAEAIELVAGTTYTLELRLLNELEDPVEDITEEVRAEAEEHMFFIYGEGVMGPASSSSSALVSHTYADLESDYGDNLVGEDLPLGLRNTITASAEGSSQLRVMLRHLPELNGAAQKSGDLPQALAEGEALPGEVDVDVSFELSVIP